MVESKKGDLSDLQRTKDVFGQAYIFATEELGMSEEVAAIFAMEVLSCDFQITKGYPPLPGTPDVRHKNT